MFAEVHLGQTLFSPEHEQVPLLTRHLAILALCELQLDSLHCVLDLGENATGLPRGEFLDYLLGPGPGPFPGEVTLFTV